MTRINGKVAVLIGTHHTQYLHRYCPGHIVASSPLVKLLHQELVKKQNQILQIDKPSDGCNQLKNNVDIRVCSKQQVNR